MLVEGVLDVLLADGVPKGVVIVEELNADEEGTMVELVEKIPTVEELDCVVVVGKTVVVVRSRVVLVSGSGSGSGVVGVVALVVEEEEDVGKGILVLSIIVDGVVLVVKLVEDVGAIVVLDVVSTVVEGAVKVLEDVNAAGVVRVVFEADSKNPAYLLLCLHAINKSNRTNAEPTMIEMFNLNLSFILNGGTRNLSFLNLRTTMVAACQKGILLPETKQDNKT